MDDPTELEWELKRAQERISRLEKDVSRLYGQLLGVAACVVLKQPPELDQDAAKAQLHHLADREPSAAIDPEYLEPAENAIAKIATAPRQRGRDG
jgi:DnaJ-domain-containing protein 1